MTHKERFNKIFSGKAVDRIPVYFFGTWHETKQRWLKEGCVSVKEIYCDPGPQLADMDPDWEEGLWNCHGLADISARGDIKEELVEDAEDYRIVKNALGDTVKLSKIGSTINHTLSFGLKPTAESFEEYKRFLNPKDSHRYCPKEEFEEIVKRLNSEDRVLPLMGGSLYGYMRNFMGIEELSVIMYEDPELLDIMLDYMVNFYIEVLTPVVRAVKFDFVYIFEDCCGADGPLFSPKMYQRFFHLRYQRLLSFYKNAGIPLALIDSDGKVDPLIPCFVESGFDIIFPVENGKWNHTPEYVREKFGREIKMLGGVDKHVIPLGENAIRAHLKTMKKQVEEGGFIPIPDHRIPPSCSYEEFKTYVRIFNEVFNGEN